MVPRRTTHPVKVGDVVIGGESPIVVQTMCNTHTCDVDATVAQCRRLAAAGAALIRITVPGRNDVAHIREIRSRLRAEGITTPLVADIHFSSETALAVAPYVEKVRINPGNFHKDHAEACRRFTDLLAVCRAHGTAVRIGLNHGSLGAYITDRFGNTPDAMAEAAMEWLRLCRAADFDAVVVSLKSSNTVSMVEAYRALVRKMDAEDFHCPLHLGVTEAGGGDPGRIKSLVGISALLEEGIGDTVRVSLTEDPEAELPVARYLAERYSGVGGAMSVGSSDAGQSPAATLTSTLLECRIEGRKAVARYDAPDRERLLCDFACDWGKKLLDRELDEVELPDEPEGAYLCDELLQAARRRFYRPEYIACPGCGRTMYDIQGALQAVRQKTAHLRDIVIAVMGCIVNGPGEMADADWGYVGEGGGKVTLYRGRTPVLRHIDEKEAPQRLLELIEQQGNTPNA